MHGEALDFCLATRATRDEPRLGSLREHSRHASPLSLLVLLNSVRQNLTIATQQYKELSERTLGQDIHEEDTSELSGPW